MKTLRLQGDSTTDLDQAASLLRQGDLVAVPTETVYGLAANATDETAVQGIFQAKCRPANHPLIVHLWDLDQLSHWADNIPAAAYQLAEAYWPGPLTLLLPKHPDVNPVITGGLDSIGLRMPAHPVLLALLRKAKISVAAPSANPYKKLSPTTADQVYQTLQGKIAAVVDGGPCTVGIESTIVDLTGTEPRVLRPGPITPEQIAAVLQQDINTPAQHQELVPGNVEEHYQPGKPLWLLTPEQMLSQSVIRPEGIACVHYSGPIESQAMDVMMPIDKADYAQMLYRTLYQLDQSEAQVIWLELPPHTAEWADVHDRLRRAGRLFEVDSNP